MTRHVRINPLTIEPLMARLRQHRAVAALLTRLLTGLLTGLLIGILLQIPVNAFATETFYTVKPGDTLWGISEKRLNDPNDWKKLQQLNKIENPHQLAPDSRIRIPVALLKTDRNRAVIKHIQGDVSVTNKDGKMPAIKPDIEVFEGDSIITGDDSNVGFEFKTGSTSSLQENSQLTIKKIRFAEDSKADRDIQLQLLQGNITNNVKKSTNPNSRFIISTPSAVASVRGTNFRVSNDPLTQQFRTEVLEGSVGVSSQGKVVVVEKGFGVAIKEGQPPSTPTKLLPAADLSNLRREFNKMPVFFRFPPIKNAISYRVELSKGKGKEFGQQIFGQDISKPEISFSNLNADNYVLRVFSYNKNGLGGQVAYHQFNVQLPSKTPPPKIPTLVFPDDGAIFEEKQFAFLWGESDTENGYHFQLANDARFTQLRIDVFPYYFTRLAIADRLPSGRYFWHVAALDKKNKIQSFTSQFTEARSFRISPSVPVLAGAGYKKGNIQLSWHSGSPKTTTHEEKQKHQYHLQISAISDFSLLLLDTTISNAHYRLPIEEPGDYFVRVSSIGTDGYEGKMSRVQHVKLLKKGFFGRTLINVDTHKKTGEP